jgi:hypothetical protein
MPSTELALPGVRVVGFEDMGDALSPHRPQSVSNLDSHPRVGLEVANVTGAVAVLGDDPEGFTHEAVADRGAAGLARVATGGL